MLSKEHNHEIKNKIKLSRVKEILQEMGMCEEEIELLTAEMTEMVEMIKGEAYIDIDKFVKSPE